MAWSTSGFEAALPEVWASVGEPLHVAERAEWYGGRRFVGGIAIAGGCHGDGCGGHGDGICAGGGRQGGG